MELFDPMSFGKSVWLLFLFISPSFLPSLSLSSYFPLPFFLSPFLLYIHFLVLCFLLCVTNWSHAPLNTCTTHFMLVWFHRTCRIIQIYMFLVYSCSFKAFLRYWHLPVKYLMVFNWTDAKLPQIKCSSSGFCVHCALTFFPIHVRNVLLISSLFLK